MPPHPPEPAPAPHDYRPELHALVAMGMDLARKLHAHGMPAPDAPPPGAHTGLNPGPEPTLPTITAAFDRIGRTIRRTVLLIEKLGEPPTLAAPTRTTARKQIIRAVEDSIHKDAPATAAEPLRAELRDRLDAPDFEYDLTTMPIEHIIQDIRRDLGLASMPGARIWRRRTPADTARLHIQATAPAGQRQAPEPRHAPAPEPATSMPPPSRATSSTPPASAAEPAPRPNSPARLRSPKRRRADRVHRPVVPIQ